MVNAFKTIRETEAAYEHTVGGNRRKQDGPNTLTECDLHTVRCVSVCE